MVDKINLLPDEKLTKTRALENQQASSLSDEKEKEKKTKNTGGIFLKFFKKASKLKNTEFKKNEDHDVGINSEVNFIIDDLIIPPSKEVIKRLVFLGGIFIICLSVTLGAYIYLIIKEEFITSEIEIITKENEDIGEEINSLKNTQEELTVLNNKLDFINEILDNHIYWTKFFGLLERYTLEGVSYSNFDMDISGALKLVAKARDYKAVSDQLFIFNSYPQYFEEMDIDSIAVNEDETSGQVDGIRFVFSLKINPDIFYLVPGTKQKVEEKEEEEKAASEQSAMPAAEQE